MVISNVQTSTCQEIGVCFKAISLTLNALYVTIKAKAV